MGGRNAAPLINKKAMTNEDVISPVSNQRYCIFAADK